MVKTCACGAKVVGLIPGWGWCMAWLEKDGKEQRRILKVLERGFLYLEWCELGV